MKVWNKAWDEGKERINKERNGERTPAVARNID
jgi:hypothetical protein